MVQQYLVVLAGTLEGNLLRRLRELVEVGRLGKDEMDSLAGQGAFPVQIR